MVLSRYGIPSFFFTKWVWKSLSCVQLCDPMDYTVHGILQDWILEWVAFPFSRGSPNQGIEPRSPPLQMDSLPAKTQGKPKNTGVGSLSLLQQIFPTQESNQGLLHCRQILYHVSHLGSLGSLEIEVIHFFFPLRGILRTLKVVLHAATNTQSSQK